MTIDLDAYREESLATWGAAASGWEERREWMTEITGATSAWPSPIASARTAE